MEIAIVSLMIDMMEGAMGIGTGMIAETSNMVPGIAITNDRYPFFK